MWFNYPFALSESGISCLEIEVPFASCISLIVDQQKMNCNVIHSRELQVLDEPYIAYSQVPQRGCSRSSSDLFTALGGFII